MKLNLAVLCASALLATTASAQNVVITNARILDGTGKVIDNGSIVARDGRAGRGWPRCRRPSSRRW